MSNIKLILEYDGTGFSGWQKQPGAGLRTVQGVLEEALERLTGIFHVTVGAGRTDTGVHALGQVAHFFTESEFPLERWPAALNGLLPPDVSVRSAEVVDDTFHARCSAKAKEYCYLFLNRPQRSAIWHRYSYRVPQRLDRGSMVESAKMFTGTHDFKAFSAAGSSARSTVRKVFTSSVFESGDWIGFRVVANGFLYRMVRLMAGMLLEVGLGKADPGRIPELLGSGQRGKGGPTLPPRGLFLVRIAYEDTGVRGKRSEAGKRFETDDELNIISEILGISGQ
jgi:tRNA pseudouridine38-40 synthase